MNNEMNMYQFTNTWFDGSKHTRGQLIPQIRPEKILEIGSFEGASACYLIDKLATDCEMEIHCVDTWEGGIENKPGGHAQADMNSVEARFVHNTRLALSNVTNRTELVVHKGYSDMQLAKLLALGKQNYFDMAYIDGSHQAPDVLCDAVLGFKLLKVGGYMFFDDYLWVEELPYGKDPLRCPKPAIDAFININFRKLHILPAPLNQLYIKKLSD